MVLLLLLYFLVMFKCPCFITYQAVTVYGQLPSLCANFRLLSDNSAYINEPLNAFSV